MCWKKASERDWDSKKRVKAPALWCNARRTIEMALNIHVMKNNKNCDRSYIEGWLVQKEEEGQVLLGGNEWIHPGDKVVVYVKPVDNKLYARHSPKIYTEREWLGLTENERIDHVTSLTFNQTVYVGDALSMSIAQQEMEPPKEDPDTHCQLCGRSGHTPHWCTSRHKPGFVPLKWRKKPHGIPRQHLREARQEEYDEAFLDSSGRMLVVIPKSKRV